MIDLSGIERDALAEFILERRWFGAKSRQVSDLRVMDTIELVPEEPPLVLALVETRFAAGTHAVYQVPLGLRHVDEGWQQGVVCTLGDRTVYDALQDPEQCLRLHALVRGSQERGPEEHHVRFQWHAPAENGTPGEARLIGTEQSNSSVVIGERYILKAYRRLDPGINPELELLRFLTERGFEHVPRLVGWYELSGRLMDATLGVVQEYLPDARDGWEHVLDRLAAGAGDDLSAEIRDLGRVTAELHNALGSERTDPAFAPEEPSSETLSLLTASVDEEIEQIFHELPEDAALDPIAGRGEDVREQLRMLTNVGTAGKAIRHHGDYHLGQVVLASRGWVVLDFEGEPARPVVERRRKRSPLRDVAGMLRSFAYAASAAERRGGAPPEGWERRAREDFLESYLETVDSSLLPAGHEGITRLLSIYELEKAVYELRYELDHRPDWVPIPVAGIARLLELAPA